MSVKISATPSCHPLPSVHFLQHLSKYPLITVKLTINNNNGQYTGRWNLLLGISAGRTSSSAHGLDGGWSAKNHHSPTFHSFNIGTSPSSWAVTSHCHPLQLMGVNSCGLEVNCFFCSHRTSFLLNQSHILPFSASSTSSSLFSDEAGVACVACCWNSSATSSLLLHHLS